MTGLSGLHAHNPPSSTNKIIFLLILGEKVLCFHGPLLYEAKCVKAEMRDKAVHYFIHYNGWNKNWDEWVPESRVLKFNDSGVQKQKELLKAHVQMGSKRNKTKGKDKDSASGDKKQKGKGKDKEDEKDKDKERSSTPTVEKTAKQKGRGKDKEKEDDKEKERSSTPTVEKLIKQKGRGKDKEEDKDKERSSRSSTPTSDRLTTKTKGQQHGTPSSVGSSQEAPASTTATPSATPIDQKRKRRAEQGGTDTPTSSTPSQEAPASTTATPTSTTIDQKRKRRAEQTLTDTPTSSVDSLSSASTPSDTKPRKRGRPEIAPMDSPQPSSQLSDSASLTSTPTEQKRKRVRGENTIETEESYLTKIEVKIKIPEELKPWLVDDWDLITRQKHLLSLPCRQTVVDILDEYVKVKTAKNSQNRDPVVEVTEGIKEYFNVMLGTQLLYKFERPQYGEIMKELPDKPMSSIYGAIHLLRLFVKLGGMLAYTALDEKSIQLLQTHIHDFLSYMVKNTPTLFSLGDYQVASPDYHRKAI
ncbi:hypothetical protein FSP39_009541 [Pinctada imbricata]|uniref:Mortality factor 4-like protein 1 n=1 Tax=Pinctada imbricata TaxID=66713 RepID=A0AA89C0C4_PINIB|nr:hypothetical protein FSP39_009541 [Pinctada imbricata]